MLRLIPKLADMRRKSLESAEEMFSRVNSNLLLKATAAMESLGLDDFAFDCHATYQEAQMSESDKKEPPS